MSANKCRFCDNLVGSDWDFYSQPVCRTCAELIAEIVERDQRNRHRRGAPGA